ncbi:bifunctional acetate--CoA ligase family protein/GNAT family N-acetyltransferase [Flammeovirgaceae bacterium SG7u.111]|nr:bifunctional acetate--CoA ligase family protein/GNAT family N-acetyltransferase [Flammeovirgaceae bacterium SG7u.132]WPO34309.1 bifunctional acetate--CoA ligase family protein/GNAT family N-acetyltransferase [Flammeovirgaceae bacterium SG7u.111]
MKKLFHPASIAVIGASEKENTAGNQVFKNLKNAFGGKLFPINLNHDEILNTKAFTNIREVKEAVDLAVITLKPAQLSEVVKDCAKAGVEYVVLISENARNRGSFDTYTYEEKIKKLVERYKIRILGPNSIGLMSLHNKINASTAITTPKPGNIAFVSQSGALCNSILDWGLRENVGFSHFISLGDMIDINWGDLLLYLGDDPYTKAILLYMESVGNARAFLSAAREVALTKPIIMIKAGKTNAASRAAAFHTGAPAGADAVLDAAFRRTGVLRVETVAELFYMASLLSKQPTPRGNRIAIVSNAGGPAVLATDALMRNGAVLSVFHEKTVLALKKNNQLEGRKIANPLDLHRNAQPKTFVAALELVWKDPETDAILLIISPQFLLNIKDLSKQVIELSRKYNKPLIVSLMGGGLSQEGNVLLNKANIPVFSFPDTAAKLFGYMWKYAYNLKGIYETPRMLSSRPTEDLAIKKKVDLMLNICKKEKRKYLSEFESKAILSRYGLPVIPTQLATSEKEAVAKAEELGYPVALKVHADRLVHKARFGGVVLNLHSETAVRAAYQEIKNNIEKNRGEDVFLGVTVQKMFGRRGYELVVGSKTDEQLGPIMVFGNGGRNLEIYNDKAFGLPPLNTTLTRRMLEQTKIYRYLKENKKLSPQVFDKLENMMVQFSKLVIDFPQIKEIDLNPVVVSEHDIQILDAAIVLHPFKISKKELPKLAIRPYPTQYEHNWEMKSGEEIFVRPIMPEDEPLIIQFHKTLSDQSVYFRYFHSVSYDYRVSHDRLARICFVDYDREIALVALRPGAEGDTLLAVGRIVKMRTENECEFSITISDAMQGMGLGTHLLKKLIEVAKAEGLEKIKADILPENRSMRKVCEKLGFKLRLDMEEQMTKAELSLKDGK